MVANKEPERTHWSESGFKAALLKVCQLWQQHVGDVAVDHGSTVDLWLQRMSTTDACLMKAVLRDVAYYRAEGPKCPKSWSRLPCPPDDGVFDGLQGKGAIRSWMLVESRRRHNRV